MTRQYVIETLREHQAELESAGILHLRIFGSVARAEETAASDIDLLAEFDNSKPLTLVTIGSLRHRLTSILGTEVDLSSAAWMKEPVRSKAQAEAVVAF